MSKRPPRQRNLYQRGGMWWGYFKSAGRRYRRSLRTTDEGEARRRLKAWRAEIERGNFGEAKTPTFKEAVIKWGREVLPKAVKSAVGERYLSSIRQLAPHLQALRVDQINKRTIAGFISARTSQGASNATIRRDLTALSRLLSSCVAWGWIEENHARYFDRSIIREQRDPIQPPSETEVAAVIEAAPAGMASILRLLAATGMRENEAVTLGAEDVAWLRRQITLTKTKTNRARTIDWRTPGGDAGAVLDSVTSRAGYLFTTEAGAPYGNFSSNFGRVIRDLIAREKKAGRTFRRFRVHDLRHGFAIRWLREGGDIFSLSRHLGHTSVKTTEIYLGYLTGDEAMRARGKRAD